MNVYFIEPSDKYVDYIFNSEHYLNSPKFMLNYQLECLYRQARGLENNKEIEFVADFLKRFQISKPVENAKKFVEFRSSISIQEFEVLNENSYFNNLPADIEKRHEYINNWYKSHTKYFSPIYTGGKMIVKSVDDFPYKKLRDY